MEKLACFTVVKPQGIKGELKVRILADGFESVKNVKKIYDKNGVEYVVSNVKNAFNGFAFLSLNSVVTRNDAELLRDVTFFVQKSSINKAKNDYFITDLIGLKVVVDGVDFGVVKDVIKANVDMFEIELNSKKKAYFPFLKKLNLSVDLANKTLTGCMDDLSGVIYYED